MGKHGNDGQTEIERNSSSVPPKKAKKEHKSHKREAPDKADKKKRDKKKKDKESRTKQSAEKKQKHQAKFKKEAWQMFQTMAATINLQSTGALPSKYQEGDVVPSLKD